MAKRGGTRKEEAPAFSMEDWISIAKSLAVSLLLYLGFGVFFIAVFLYLWKSIAGTWEMALEFATLFAFMYLLPLISVTAWLLGIRDIPRRNRAAIVALIKPSAATVVAMLLPIIPGYGKRGLAMMLLALALMTFFEVAGAYWDDWKLGRGMAKLAWLWVVLGGATAVLTPIWRVL